MANIVANIRAAFAGPRRNVAILITVAATVISCTLCLCVFALTRPSSTATPTVAPTSKPALLASTVTTAPTRAPTAIPRAETNTPYPTREPTSAPLPSATLTAQQAVTKALGASNRKVERITKIAMEGQTFAVYWAINDPGFGEMPFTVKQDAVKILRAAAAYGYDEVAVTGSFPMKDTFGNTKEDVVVTATYSKATLAKVNWDGFDYKNVWTIADESIIHPQFR